MRTPIKAGVAGVALATAGALFLGVPSASGTHQSESSAFGASVGGQPGMPMAQYPEGPTEAGGQLPAELGPLASGGALTVTAGNDQAAATITNLTLGAAVADLPPELTEAIGQLQTACTAFTTPPAQAPDGPLDTLNEALNQAGLGNVFDFPTSEDATAFCNALLDGQIPNLAVIGSLQTQCQGDTGTVTLTDVSVLGAEQPVLEGEVAPGTPVLPAELNPNGMGLSITLNRQTQNGDVLTVDGLVIEAGGEEVAVLSSVTCGAPIVHTPPTTTPTPTPAPAPAPTPVVQNVPVTG